jgi:hypothetical protein
MTKTFRKFESRLNRSLTIFAATDATEAAALEIEVCCNPHANAHKTPKGSIAIKSRNAADVAFWLVAQGWAIV